MMNSTLNLSPKQLIDALSSLNLPATKTIIIEAVGNRPEIYRNIFPCLVNCHVYYKGLDELGRASSCDVADCLFVDEDADPNTALTDYSSVITCTPSGFVVTTPDKTITIDSINAWAKSVSFY